MVFDEGEGNGVIQNQHGIFTNIGPQSSGRVNDPMSFSNILASSDERPASPTTHRKHSISSNATVSQTGGSPTGPSFTSSFDRKPSTHSRQISNNAVNYLPTPDIPPKIQQQQTKPQTPVMSSSMDKPRVNGDVKPAQPPSPPRESKPKIVIAEKDVQVALAKIESLEHSDVDVPGFKEERERYLDSSRKRKREVESLETTKREVSLDSRIGLYKISEN